MTCPRIIPTPVQANLSEDLFPIAGLRWSPSPDLLPYAEEMLAKFRSDKTALPLRCAPLHNPPEENQQAYRLTLSPQEILLEVASPLASIYGAASLCQLLQPQKDGWLLPQGTILDYPQFETRGVNWLLMVECRGWSMERCDGKEAFVKRVTSALDTLAYFKLNATFIDGIGWNPERFPGYSALMRQLAKEARRRGIHLCFSGYSEGYGTQWYECDGPSFRNRHEYPDGEPYPCMHTNHHSPIAQTMGTCLGNRQLLHQKQKNLHDFTQAVEPGMLYIHGLDISTRQDSQDAWMNRCSECRKRWPNDTIAAPDGMAGAFAELYDSLYEAIASVKNPETDYDAERDCIVNFVGPNYTDYNETEEEWEFHLEYFEALTKCLKHKKIQLLFREQFLGGRGQLRFRQMRDTVTPGQKLAIIHFSSGSGFYNSLPVTAEASSSKFFLGLNQIITGSGNGFQEPRQAITAEYLWNPLGTAYPVDYPGEYQAFLKKYDDLRFNREMPASVFGENGLLQEVCRKLYGTAAAIPMARALKGYQFTYKSDISNEPTEKTVCITPFLSATNARIPGNHFVYYRRTGRRIFWADEQPELTLPHTLEQIPIVEQCLQWTRQCLPLLKQAAVECASPITVHPEMRQKHLEELLESATYAEKLGTYTLQWLRILAAALPHKTSRKLPAEIEKQINDLLPQVTAFEDCFRKRTANALEHEQGDIGQAATCAWYIKSDLENILHYFKTGEFRVIPRNPWW